MDLAIVGLPQSGKSTAFRALTAGHGSATSDARGEHIGAVKIPDERLDKLAVNARSGKLTEREAAAREQQLLARCHKHLEAEQPLRNQALDDADARALANYGLLSLKPMLLLLNIDEGDAASAPSIAEQS